MGLDALQHEIVSCRACPRLVAWREDVAVNKRASFRDEEYWGRPLPGFGDPGASVVVIGLAPAAHGANRTGRMFTGDRSGEWLYAALYRAGYANQATSTARDDDLALRGAWITAAVRCAPPSNLPTREERDRCRPYLERELGLLDQARVLVTLGGFAFDACWPALRARGTETPRPKPKFAHGVEIAAGPYVVLGCYHPSQQNTFTGRLTEPMLDAVLRRARELSERTR